MSCSIDNLQETFGDEWNTRLHEVQHEVHVHVICVNDINQKTLDQFRLPFDKIHPYSIREHSDIFPCCLVKCLCKTWIVFKWRHLRVHSFLSLLKKFFTLPVYVLDLFWTLSTFSWTNCSLTSIYKWLGDDFIGQWSIDWFLQNGNEAFVKWL